MSCPGNERYLSMQLSYKKGILSDNKSHLVINNRNLSISEARVAEESTATLSRLKLITFFKLG